MAVSRIGNAWQRFRNPVMQRSQVSPRYELSWVAGAHGLPKLNAAIDANGVEQTVVAGAAAGDVTVTGIATEDTLVSVVHIDMGANAETDLTSEFSIGGADTINNDGGTSSANDTLIVTYIDSSANTAKTADPFFEILGTNASSDDVTYYAEGGIDMQTDTGSADQVILLPHLDSGVSPWTGITWGTDQLTEWECELSLEQTADTLVWAGLKLTNTSTVATDDDQAFFRYSAAGDSNWQAVSSNNGTDTTTDTGVAAGTSRTHLAITIDSDRVARFYINGEKVETTSALADTHDFIPYIGVQTETTAAKGLFVHGQAISRAKP